MSKRIRFSRNCSPYNAGEEATFSDTQADLYIKRGAATLVVKSASAAPAKQPTLPQSKN